MNESNWFASHSKPLIFLIITLAVLGVYLAFTIPVAVFPTTNFPRILIAVDNGVMPIDQMMVMVTRPIEEAVNSVPGLTEVRSNTSRGSAEIDLFFDGEDRTLGVEFDIAALAVYLGFGFVGSLAVFDFLAQPDQRCALDLLLHRLLHGGREIFHFDFGIF